MSTQFFLDETDIDTLINLLLRSQQSRTREALCFSIGIDPKRLSFIRDSSDSDFFLLLIKYLNEIGEQEALCKLCCKELSPVFRHGKYATILSEIAAKLNCNQRLSQNSTKNQQPTVLSSSPAPSVNVNPFNQLVKNKLITGRTILLIGLAGFTLSAIYSYFWLPDIWSSAITQVTVNAQSDPWLAGMPPNSEASSCPNPRRGDLPSIAPQNSPTEVKEIPLKPGSHLTFKVLQGKTKVFKEQEDYFEPEGKIKQLITHDTKAENGISDIQAPINSLVGVFLGREEPNKDSAPSTLFFSEEAKRNYLKLDPKLKQVFFIGDGRTNMGIRQRVIVPLGATRLYLGIMDGCNWRDTDGYLDVEVSNHQL
jgi:hypothetical protein